MRLWKTASEKDVPAPPAQPNQEKQLGLRQVNVFTGLNAMILLLELHCYAQKRAGLKDAICFYPSGQATEERWTDRLLNVIHYNDCLELGTFTRLPEFSSPAPVSTAPTSPVPIFVMLI